MLRSAPFLRVLDFERLKQDPNLQCWSAQPTDSFAIDFSGISFDAANIFSGDAMICRCRLLLTLVLTTSAGCASAQVGRPSDSVLKSPDSVVTPYASGAKPFNPFAVPTGLLLCHLLPRNPAWPQGFIVFEFEDGTLMINDRLIDAAYDSVGTPRLLVVSATEKLGGQPPIMHGFSVSFPDDKPATGFHIVNSSAGGGTLEPPRDVLPPAMIADSRNLLLYLWSHRCERGRAEPTPGTMSSD